MTKPEKILCESEPLGEIMESALRDEELSTRDKILSHSQSDANEEIIAPENISCEGQPDLNLIVPRKDEIITQQTTLCEEQQDINETIPRKEKIIKPETALCGSQPFVEIKESVTREEKITTSETILCVCKSQPDINAIVSRKEETSTPGTTMCESQPFNKIKESVTSESEEKTTTLETTSCESSSFVPKHVKTSETKSSESKPTVEIEESATSVEGIATPQSTMCESQAFVEQESYRDYVLQGNENDVLTIIDEEEISSIKIDEIYSLPSQECEFELENTIKLNVPQHPCDNIIHKVNASLPFKYAVNEELYQQDTSDKNAKFATEKTASSNEKFLSTASKGLLQKHVTESLATEFLHPSNKNNKPNMNVTGQVTPKKKVKFGGDFAKPLVDMSSINQTNFKDSNLERQKDAKDTNASKKVIGSKTESGVSTKENTPCFNSSTPKESLVELTPNCAEAKNIVKARIAEMTQKLKPKPPPPLRSPRAKSNALNVKVEEEATELPQPIEPVVEKNPYFTLAELIAGVEGVVFETREQMLSPTEFLDLFKMTKEEFLELPKWKQAQKKKNVGLF